jgi:uncharacterized membrane protein YhaH (DUF805 family)
MSWGEILFGFHGRINRKTYWFASIPIALAGLAFNALLTYLATGNPAAPEVWQRPAGKSGIWVPVWLAYFLFLAVKRLHDRGRPAWLWYAYFAASIVLTLMPARTAADGGLDPAANAALVLVLFFGLYIIFELSVLRGMPGANQYGGDTMPSGYYGGDYSFLSWMLALEGRISRKKWWLGLLIVIGVFAGAVMALIVLADEFIRLHPGLEQNLSNPEWLKSKEAEPLLLQLMLWTALPSLVVFLAFWSLVALSVKRLHDRGLSSWLILVVVLPFFGAFLAPAIAGNSGLGENLIVLALLLVVASAIWSVLQFGIFRGETGPNRHGPDPLAGQS